MSQPAPTTSTTDVPEISPKPTAVLKLRQALANLGLDTCGSRTELKKRLRKAQKKASNQSTKPSSAPPSAPPEDGKLGDSDDGNVEKIVARDEETKKIAKRKKQPFDYYLCFDVEATCDYNGGFDYPNEIIEFPVVLLDGKTFEIVDEFQSYVKPTLNPILTDFCVSLTGIQQSSVDAAPSFPEMLIEFQDFLEKYSLFQDNSAAFITDGPFDIRDFITKQVAHSNIPRPEYFSGAWVDIRMIVQQHYKPRMYRNLDGMLKHLGMKFEGRPHSGLDDAKNVARIVRRVWNDGAVVRCNREIRLRRK